MMSFTHPRREQIWLMCFAVKGFRLVRLCSHQARVVCTVRLHAMPNGQSIHLRHFLHGRIQNSFPPHC